MPFVVECVDIWNIYTSNEKTMSPCSDMEELHKHMQNKKRDIRCMYNLPWHFKAEK